ncbi:DUF6412 domain-containing protein [Streptomyces sp. NPDC093085]|uniref:DUF6412 domain-containing protein n=1 Tax=Streptomyces sp. NPDC093085 TaxID=3155068 RepID=UPI003446FD9A
MPGVARDVLRLPRGGGHGLLIFFLTEFLLLDAGSLATAVALAATATAAAGSALVVCAVISARSVPGHPPHRVRTAIRDREHRTAFLPQRDPDASGRPRPRAPGLVSSTAFA